MYLTPTITLDTCYIELLKPMESDLVLVRPDIDFLIDSNKTDAELIKLFPELSEKINKVSEGDYSQYVEKLMPYGRMCLSIRNSLNGQVIGFFHFVIPTNSIDIYLHADYRHRNIASRIFDEFLSQSKKSDMADKNFEICAGRY